MEYNFPQDPQSIDLSRDWEHEQRAERKYRQLICADRQPPIMEKNEIALEMIKVPEFW